MQTGMQSPSSRTTSLANVGAVLVGASLLVQCLQWDEWNQTAQSHVRHGMLAVSIALIVLGMRRILWFMVSGGVGPGRIQTRDRVVFLREGLVYLLIMIVALIGSLLGRSNTLMLVSALMTGPFVINGWIVFRMLKRIYVVRRVPRRTTAGHPVTVDLEIENRKWFFTSRLMNVQDPITGADESLVGQVLFVRIPPGSTRRGSYQVKFQQRGRYRFGPIYVSSRFPLGIGERGRVFRTRDEILVHPPVGHVSARWFKNALSATELVERQSGNRGVFDDEFHRIREFRSGDNPRAIHWRTTARHNELMVREFQQNRDHDLCVLLHLDWPKRPSADDRRQVELAVSVAATFCMDHVRDTRDAALTVAVAGDDFFCHEGRSGPATAEIVMDHLAVAAGAADVSPDRLLEAAVDVDNGSTRMVLVTTNKMAVHDALDRFAAHDDSNGVYQARLRDLVVVPADPVELESVFAWNADEFAGHNAPVEHESGRREIR